MGSVLGMVTNFTLQTHRTDYLGYAKYLAEIDDRYGVTNLALEDVFLLVFGYAIFLPRPMRWGNA